MKKNAGPEWIGKLPPALNALMGTCARDSRVRYKIFHLSCNLTLNFNGSESSYLIRCQIKLSTPMYVSYPFYFLSLDKKGSHTQLNCAKKGDIRYYGWKVAVGCTSIKNSENGLVYEGTACGCKGNLCNAASIPLPTYLQLLALLTTAAIFSGMNGRNGLKLKCLPFSMKDNYSHGRTGEFCSGAYTCKSSPTNILVR